MTKQRVMKQSRMALAAAILCLAGAAQIGADERVYEPGGMWMPQQIAEVHAGTLRKMGLQLDPAAFNDLTKFPLNTIVSLGGGSASFISPEGLAVTNHHCVTGYLQYNSKEGRNLLADGYLAQTREDELPGGPTAHIYVTQSVTDVTTRVLSGLREIGDDLLRRKTLDMRIKEIVKEAEAAVPDTRCEVAAFYAGARYFLITRLDIRDVRLVWAPHASVGAFGGDIDNWMWPRQSGDFALLRAYVGRDGKPAAYSKKNVPYRSKSHLRIAGQGVAEGDFVMVIGYPGHTRRIATAHEIGETINWGYPRSIEVSRKHVALLRQIAAGNEELGIKTAGAIMGMENGRKNLEGQLESARRFGLVDLKAAKEKKLKDWIAAAPERAAKYGGIVDRLDALLKAEEKFREKETALGNLLHKSSLLSAAMTIVRMAEERPKPDLEREPGYQERDWQRMEQSQERAQKNYAREIEQGVLELFLSQAAALPADQKPEVVVGILGSGAARSETLKSTVAEWLKQTRLADLDTRLNLLRKADTKTLQNSKDPLIQLALKAFPYVKAKEERDKRMSGAILLLRPLYFEAISEMQQGRIAPDANGTIRVTFGTVRGYSPSAGKPVCFPFTNVWEMAGKWARNRGETPFDAPAAVISAIAEKRFGPYAEAKLGGVPIDFLADLDITGGNSGSPTLNAKGEFTGIVFDGVIEGVGSGFYYQESVTRSIHADARYLKWLLDAVYPSPRLLREIGAEPAFAAKK